jgi:hypothetical protein
MDESEEYEGSIPVAVNPTMPDGYVLCVSAGKVLACRVADGRMFAPRVWVEEIDGTVTLDPATNSARIALSVPTGLRFEPVDAAAPATSSPAEAS